MRVNQRPSSTLLAGFGFVVIMAGVLLRTGLDIGRSATQGLRPAGAVTTIELTEPLCHN